MRKALTIAALLAGVALMVTRPAGAADLNRLTLVPGADAGNTAQVIGAWLPGNQFMVSCSTYSGVTYRLCPSTDAGGCTAVISDAPIEANKQIDLCAPAGYTALSLYKTYDAGNPLCGVYLVTPKTVCP